MSILNKDYENIPGITVDYLDGNLHEGPRSPGATTKSVLIIGTATDGPTNEVVSVNAIGGPEVAARLFGGTMKPEFYDVNGELVSVDVPHGGTLIRAMDEMMNTGSDDIRLIRPTGKKAFTPVPLIQGPRKFRQRLVSLQGNVEHKETLTLKDSEMLLGIEEVVVASKADPSTPIRTITGADVAKYVEAKKSLAGKQELVIKGGNFGGDAHLTVKYKVEERTYTDVPQSDDGVINPSSTDAILTQDTANPLYFKPVHTQWSSEARHSALYTIFIDGIIIPEFSHTTQKRLWRVGKEDPSVVDETSLDAEGMPTELEYKQGGIRFTQAYLDEYTALGYPELLTDGSQVVKSSYTYYETNDVTKDLQHECVVADKQHVFEAEPNENTIVLSIEDEVTKLPIVLTEGDEYELVHGATGKVEQIKILGAKAPIKTPFLLEFEGTDEEAGEDEEERVVNFEAKYAGAVYSRFAVKGDVSSIRGVSFEIKDHPTEVGEKILTVRKPEEKRLRSEGDEFFTVDTSKIPGKTTVREFTNIVNNVADNNVLTLTMAPFNGNKPLLVESLVNTNGFVYLGSIYDADTGAFELYEVEDIVEQTISYPYMGSDGTFDLTSLKDTCEIYNLLDGEYEEVQEPGKLKHFKKVEEGLYSTLENYAVDQVYNSLVFSNTAIGTKDPKTGEIKFDKRKNFATQFAQHMAKATARTWEMIGVINMAPAPEITLRHLQEYIELACGVTTVEEGSDKEAYYLSKGINPHFKNRHYIYNIHTLDPILNQKKQPIDIGYTISNIFGPEAKMANMELGVYYAPAGGIYSSLISALDEKSATTNKKIDVLDLRYSLSESQHNMLLGASYVTMFARVRNVNNQKEFKVKSGITASGLRSDYHNLSTLRVVHAVVQAVKEAAEKYIGEADTLTNKNSMTTEVHATLDRFKDTEYLKAFNFDIQYPNNTGQISVAHIRLMLVPALELRKIITTVSVHSNL